MQIEEFLPRAGGRVRIRLADGTVHTGQFRTDILSDQAISAYFYGDARDMSLPISLIASIDPLEFLQLAS